MPDNDAMQAYQQNYAARMALIPGPTTQTVRRLQQIFSQTTTSYVAGQQQVMTITPAPVGIITRFIIRVTATMGNSGGADTQTRVQNGGAAILSNIQYTDTSNITRINAPGWYLNQLWMQRRRRKATGAVTMDNSSLDGIGANYTAGINAVPATLTAAPSAANFVQFYDVPLAYAGNDLRGAVLAALINATQSLSVTINPNFFVKSTDTVNLAEAGYQSDSATLLGQISSLTVTVYQEYIDQFGTLPLPAIDLATQYQLQVTGGYVPVANTDLVIPYPNFKNFMSTTFRYNNNGTFNAGSDINYASIRAANQSDLVKVDPYTLTLLNRERVGDDLPAGYYIFDHREKPIFTNTFGNMSLVVQASSVGGANSSISVGYESLALQSQIAVAGQVTSGG